MKILLLQIDKTQEAYLAEGIGEYARRLAGYARFDIHTISVPKRLRQKTAEEQKQEEGKMILEVLDERDFLVILDENGKNPSSAEFAAFLGKQQSASVKRMVFLIGGPYGFASTVYARGNHRLSLSRMTFSHQMVRLFFLEQLYRAFTILRGEKYHHP